MFNMILGLSLGLSMELDVAWIHPMLHAGQVLAEFVHVVNASFNIILKVCSKCTGDSDVIAGSDLLASMVNGTSSAMPSTLIICELFVVFGSLNKSLGAKPL